MTSLFLETNLMTGVAAGMGVVVLLSLRDLFLQGRKTDFGDEDSQREEERRQREEEREEAQKKRQLERAHIFDVEDDDEDIEWFDGVPRTAKQKKAALRRQKAKKEAVEKAAKEETKSNKKKASPKASRKVVEKDTIVVKVIKVLRWFSCPLTATAVAWTLAIDARPILSRVPSILGHYAASIHKVLPLHPRNLQDAFDLGEAHKAFLTGAVNEAMAIATRIAGRPVDVSEIAGLPAIIADIANDTGIVTRVLSVFSIVNIAWGIAVMGLSVTLLPFLVVLTKPFWMGLLVLFTRLYDLLLRLLIWLTPLYEPLAYSFSLLMLVEATRFAESNDPYGMTGVMLTFSSVVVFAMSWAYTTAKNAAKSGDFDMFLTISWCLGALFCIPAAKTHQSVFLGYLAVAALAAAMRFSAFSSGLVVMIGWQSQRDLVRTCIGCGMITVLAAMAKAMGVQSEWYTPFAPAASVIGSSIYLLGLDILSCVDRGNYVSHVVYVGNIVAFIVAGEMLSLQELSNVGKTNAGLYLLTHYCMNPPEGDAFIIWLFSLFGALYGGSLYLNLHPEYVASLFSGGLVVE